VRKIGDVFRGDFGAAGAMTRRVALARHARLTWNSKLNAHESSPTSTRPHLSSYFHTQFDSYREAGALTYTSVEGSDYVQPELVIAHNDHRATYFPPLP
jgi:hypothetical protein